jgi:hypothetical protein
MLFHTPAFAQNEYEEFVDEQIEEFCDYIDECFWLEHVDYFTGSAAKGSGNSHYVTLGVGEWYFIYAVCDQDCDDVDLFLYGPSGSLVASDSSTQAVDDFPTANAGLEFEPTLSGTYRLEVKIYGCTTSTCYYAAEVDVW